MKYKIRKTNEIVDVVGYSACTHTRFPATDYVCYIDNKGEEIVGRGLNLIWDFELISEDSIFDWHSFRNQAAKEFTARLITVIDWENTSDENIVKSAINLADELIKQLKEKEEKQ